MNPEKKVHLLLVVRWPVGGIRTFLRYVYRHFDKNEYQLTIILPETSELEAIFENLKSIDAKFIVLPKNPNILQFITAISKTITSDHIDLIHSHGFSSGIYAALPAKFFKIPHLLTCHDVFIEKQFLGYTGWLKSKALSFAFNSADKIHCVSHDVKDNILRFFPELNQKLAQVVVIPNGVETERFHGSDRIDWRSKLGLADNTFLIGFFGRFMHQKGFKYLVEAMDALRKKPSPKSPVVLAFGWGGFIREEQAEIEKKGLQDLFRFLPFQENIADAIRGVDVVAMPSLWEAYGLLAAEVMIAGVPLVGTDCIGLREVLNDTPAVMVPAGDSKALTKALLNEIELSSTESSNSFRSEAAVRFDVKKQVEGLQKLISVML